MKCAGHKCKKEFMLHDTSDTSMISGKYDPIMKCGYFIDYGILKCDKCCGLCEQCDNNRIDDFHYIDCCGMWVCDYCYNERPHEH